MTTVSDSESATTRRRWEPYAFSAALVLGLAGTFRFSFFSSWDGPPHAASAYGMWHYGGAVETVFRRDWSPVPNLVAHLYESALLTVFGPALADRMVAATCVVGVALSIRFLCRSLSSETGALVSYLALPIAFGWFVHAGQYSFLLGVTAACLYLGWRFRSPVGDAWSRPSWLAAIALVGLYLSHLVPFAIVLLVHLVVSLPRLRSREWRKVAAEWMCTVPALVLLVGYLATGGGGGAQRRPISELIVDAATLREVLVAFTTRHEIVPVVLAVLSMGLVGVTLVVARRGLHDSTAGRVAASTALTLGVMYWIVPTNVSGGGFLTARIALLAVIMTMAAASALPPRLLRVLPVLSVLSLIGFVSLRQHQYNGFSKDIQELMEAGPYIDSHDVVLTLKMCSESQPGCASATASMTAPLSEASGFLMADRGAADLTLYEGFFNYFPLQFHSHTDPTNRLFPPGTDPSATPPMVDVAAYERLTNVTIDVIVVWGWADVANDMSIRELEPLRAALSEYHVEYTSSRGHVTVFAKS